MAIKSTGLNIKGLQAAFFEQFRAESTFFQDVSTRIASTTDREHHRWLGTVPQLREWGTGRKAKGLRTESYDIANLKYESTLEVDQDEIDDDQTGQIRIRVQELAARAATHKDYLIAQLLENGSTSGFNSYDGVPFFDANHVSGASGTQDNEIDYDISASATAGETDLITAPTPLQFGLAFQAGVQQMLSFKDDQGEPVAMGASGLVAMIPTNMFFAATAALANPSVGSFAGGDQTNIVRGMARPIVNPWLTDASKWYLLKVDRPIRPFIFQDRAPVTFVARDNPTTSDDVFMEEKYRFGTRARYRMTYGEWRYAVSIDFTT